MLVQPKRHYSALDMPAHLKLKERHEGQGSKEEQDHIDFKQDLLRKEHELARSKRNQFTLAAEDREEALAIEGKRKRD